MGRNSSPIVSRLWAKVHEGSNQCRGPLVLSNALVWLSMSYFVQKMFAIKSRSRRQNDQIYTVFRRPIFSKWRPRLFYGTFWSDLLSTVSQNLVEFCLLSADPRVQSLAMKYNAEFTEGGQNAVPILSHLWTTVHKIFRRREKPLV